MRQSDWLHEQAVASESTKDHPKRWKWRMEWLVQTGLENCLSLLPGTWVFRLGETCGELSWHLLKSRRRIVLRNLRIAFHGEFDLPTLEKMARESFRRTGASMLSAAHTAHLSQAKVREILTVENPEVVEEAVADGSGVLMLPAHMGNWEILSRMNLFFPPGHPAGTFYRPLNNPLINERIERQRSVDGMQLFRKQDSFHLLTGFIRGGGILGLLADQRVGPQGIVMRYFGRLTRVSPLPSLLARRSKAKVIAISLITNGPGKWRARYHALNGPADTEHCLDALERALKASPEDVFWFQERWKLYLNKGRTIQEWLGTETHGEGTPHRAVLWLAGVPSTWEIPDGWAHPDVIYEVVLAPGQQIPAWLDGSKFHTAPSDLSRDGIQKFIYEIDRADPLPIDFILTVRAPKALSKASARESIPLVSLP